MRTNGGVGHSLGTGIALDLRRFLVGLQNRFAIVHIEGEGNEIENLPVAILAFGQLCFALSQQALDLALAGDVLVQLHDTAFAGSA